MRVVRRSLIVLAVALLVVGLVAGQPQGVKGKGGFGKRGFGGGPLDAASLIKMDAVKKELNVTEKQTERIPDAIMKGLAGVLNEKQITRLRQIVLQQKGNQALLDVWLQKELKITGEQDNSIKTILSDSTRQLAELMAERPFAGPPKSGGFGLGDKLNSLTKETNEKVQRVLTADQRRAYKQILGEEFRLPKGGFGGFGGKGPKEKGGKNKEDI